MLAELVAKGELPPVDERLPFEPTVCPAVEGIGKYGGAWRRGFKGVSDRWGVNKVVDHSLVHFNPDLTVRPSLCKSWETNEDATVWTWHLLEGARWSDGQPLTSEDFRWLWEYQYKNKTLTPIPPTTYSSGRPSVLAELETPDDFTVIFRFSEPYPLFNLMVAQSQPFTPHHYMQNYHPDFTEQAKLDALAKEKGYQSWDQLYLDMDQWFMHPDRPVVFAWKPLEPLNVELMRFERNPYFSQIDADGNQLPYLDALQFRLFESPDTFNMWILNGEIDMQARHVDLGNYTLFKEGEAQGGYTLGSLTSSFHTCFTPNHSTKDPRLAGLFQDRRFRLAMSYAVNRQEVNDLVYNGLATPRQYSPIEGSPQYYPKLSNAHLEYDPEQANQLLDDIGISARDAEGFRLWNDGSGETITFTIEGIDNPGSPGEDHAQMEVKYFADVGIKASYKYVERSLYTEHYEANMIEAAWVIWNNRTVLPLVAPGIFLGTNTDHPWCPGWAMWKGDPANPNAVQPPEGHWIYDIWDLWEQVRVEPDDAARNDKFFKILDIWAEELPQVGYLGMFPQLTIVKKGFRNFLSGYPFDDPTGYEHLQGNQVYYWDDPENHVLAS